MYQTDTEKACFGWRAMLYIFIDNPLGIEKSFLSLCERYLVLFYIFSIFSYRPFKSDHISVW